jgi:hypothetical protein
VAGRRTAHDADAIVEDLLDRAQEAVTGTRPRPARRPLWLRVANGLDIARARRCEALPA